MVRDPAAGPVRISVALTTYEPDLDFLQRQIRSIASQTRPADEIVWSDDGSRRVPKGQIEEVVRQADVPLIDLSQPENVGLRRNWERVLRGASGEVIVLSDQDDIWRPEKLAAIAKAFEEKPAPALWFSDARLIGEHDEALSESLLELVGLTP